MRDLFGIVWTLGLLAACGTSSESSNGSSGTSGAVSGGAGGSGDSSGSGGSSAGSRGESGGSGGGAGVSTGGTGGSSAGRGGALDPDLPAPSYDCRTDTTSGACVSVSGTLVGVSIDRHCARLGASTSVTMSPPAWPLACVEQELGPTVGYWYGIAVPPQMEGSFRYDIVAGEPSIGAGIALAHDDVGGSSIADHFEGGAIEGATTYDAVIDVYTVTGTFRGRWGMPTDSTCEAGSPAICGEAHVHGTFRLQHF